MTVITRPLPPPCRVAIVGAGNTAAEHARAFRDVPGVTLTGVHSRTRIRTNRFATEHAIPLVCDSVAELYERTRPDLVVVTVNELAAQAIGRAVFEFPCTVLMEKPAGYCMSDAEALHSAAISLRRRVFVALNRRFYSSTTRVLDDLSSIDLPRFIKVQDQQSQCQARHAGKPDEVVANWMFANAIHTIDYLRLFGRGRLRAVHSVVPWNPDSPGVVVSQLHFDSGDVGLYEGIWHGPGPWAISLTVAGQRWEMRPLERLERQVLGQRPEQVETHRWDREYKPGFRAQAEQAVHAALGLPSTAVTISEAMDTMRIVSAIFQAP